MKTILYTSFPCVVKFNESQESLTVNENLSFEEEFDKLWVYPTEKGRISFEVTPHQQESSFYRIIERGNKRLIFLLDGLYAQNAEIAEFEYNGVKSKIEIYPQKVVFLNKNNKKIIHLNQKYRSYKVGNKKYIDYCLLSNFDGQDTLLAYNAQKNTARVFNGDEIQEDDDGFRISYSAFGYTSIIQQLYIDEDGLKVRKKDFISSGQSLPDETLAYEFLSSFKLGDYSKCLSMLSAELNDRLSEESLKAYFGNISYFYMIDPHTAYAISNDKNVIFEFSVKNSKINEISSE